MSHLNQLNFGAVTSCLRIGGVVLLFASFFASIESGGGGRPQRALVR